MTDGPAAPMPPQPEEPPLTVAPVAVQPTDQLNAQVKILQDSIAEISGKAAMYMAAAGQVQVELAQAKRQHEAAVADWDAERTMLLNQIERLQSPAPKSRQRERKSDLAVAPDPKATASAP
jgi:hypothetical protein